MYCPKCGKNVDDSSNFCTDCGFPLFRCHIESSTYERYSDQQTYTNTQYNDYSGSISRKTNNKWIVAIFILAILAVACGLVALNNEKDAHVTETITVGDYTFEVDEAFTDNTYAIETTEHEFDGTMKKCISITLNNEISSEYGWFQWKLTNKNSFDYVPYIWNNGKKIYTDLKCDDKLSYLYEFEKNPQTTVTKSEPVLYWVCDPGVYSISVTCFKLEDSTNTGKKYSGNITVIGNVVKDYSWKFENNTFETQVSFPLTEFIKYSDKNPKYRWISHSSQSTNYVIVDDTIKDLSSKLTELYIKTYGTNVSINDQRFADYLLAFIQYCFKYPAFNERYNGDYVIYGVNEYFAYPLETMYLGYGDCEDTSILSAAIYSACGYNSAICIIPNHAMVGVALDNYTEPTHSNDYRILKQTIDEKTYYGGETTMDDYLALGLSTKDNNGNWFTDSIGKYEYRFYPVISS